ncbi:MAG: hypothetical protein IPL63_11885 [Saprospiraceae bacterium]|nr:hypothetical protein [Saprospiraceae bacterium]
MLRYLFVVVLIFSGRFLLAQSPHGSALIIDCSKCHIPENWTFQQSRVSFSHDSTSFILTGQHKGLECRSCHSTLVFEEAKNECISCHTDVHQQTVGNDCARCHTTTSWIVENITVLHENIAFPLIGVHSGINCNDCHKSENNVIFSPTGVTCIDCHRNDYINANNPNHIKNNFGTDCAECHSLTGPEWNSDIIDHGFFPLVQGHSGLNCVACHQSGTFDNISKECISCHMSDFLNTATPNHSLSGFSTDCTKCHSLSPGWNPVVFTEHDIGHFPIYSGKHAGVWTSCTECHTNSNDYSTFSCIVCHTNPETNDIHQQVSGYQYNDNACLGCHPTGDGDMAFDHNLTAFPLTGAHRFTDCVSCHANGYKGTSTVCVDCHMMDYTQSLNPDHKKIGLPADCKQCHSTEPGWSPARFDEHDQYYPLNGAHKLIKEDCIVCHQGNYNATPNTCYGCHTTDYKDAQDPDHELYNFSTDCAMCHSENAWQPSTFNHDVAHFPIYSGKHNGVWNNCAECHTVPGDLTKFSCTNCHINPETNNVHTGVPGYAYNDNACFACHPTGDADQVFNHNQTNFPLTGAHITADCIQCHQNGYEGTTTICMDCHLMDYNQAINPNHITLGIQKDCALCHTTNPGWSPARFPEHNSYYMLLGAHALIAQDCATCHNGDYNNTPNTCVGCHNTDYQNTTDPNHVELQFPKDCASCHSENAWEPSTFNHDGMFFPIYSGKHKGEWNECRDCHNSPGNWEVFDCLSCHQNPETNEDHEDVPGYIYQSVACLACHPTGDAGFIFDHATTGFQLTGGHINATCIDCHTSGFEGTSTVCNSCHMADFNNALNPNHIQLNISSDCSGCHSTTPGWGPALFPNHNDFYLLEGAHTSISNDCIACHNGDYNNTPNTCVGCHLSDFTNTVDPDHEAQQFPTDCASCHGQQSWEPSTFNHNTIYALVGAHAAIANDCNACHNGNYTNTPNTCFACHQTDYNNTTNPDHEAANFPTNCIICHSQNAWMPADFNHDIVYPLTGAHALIADQCTSCHVGGYNNTPSTCVGCHQADFNTSANPNHPALQIPTDCALCHTTTPGWQPATFPVHDNYYVIMGAHVGLDCATCHNGNYNNTPNTCVGCHQPDYNTALNPNHTVNQFPTDCTICHSQQAWTPSSFNHNDYYPLTGAHLAVAQDCNLCHMGSYNNTPNTCVGCHQNDFNTSVNPNHPALQISTDCALCHTTTPGWQPATFPVHDNYYVIQGAHVGLDCAACHNGNYNNTPNTCVGCHQSDYNTALNPNHAVNQFPTDCTICHSQQAWTPSSFNHNDYYPLTGAHLAVAQDCNLCHMGSYNNTPNTCVGCHQNDFNTSVNPNHPTLQISTDCALCHTTTPGWQPATFPVHDNYYVIQGAHVGLDCAACHNGNYNNTPNTCVGCHQSDYNTALNPNHAVNQFPTDCTICHTQQAWTPSSFNHNDYYPLTGAHLSVAQDCNLCHMGSYNNTPNTCVGCHQNDYNSSINPNHIALGLSNDCVTCHTTAPGWQPALFSVHNNYYVLQGAHVSLECIDCHNGNYNNTPNTCIGCHLNDYNNTNNPDHQVAAFPTDCTLCHSQNHWTPSTFDHDNMYFPIFSGRHDNEWNLCSECHTNPNNYNIFSCINCHEHSNQTEVNHDHQGVSGYQYNSNACYSCHPTGEN